MLIPLVQKLNRPCTPDLLWQAILGIFSVSFIVLSLYETCARDNLGVTDHYLRSNITEDLYNSICSAIKVF
jgi:hypothetical protein